MVLVPSVVQNQPLPSATIYLSGKKEEEEEEEVRLLFAEY